MNLCRNALPVEEGACTRRPGTILAGTTRNGVAGVIWDFDFSENHPYTLEFTPGFLRLRSGASLVTEGPTTVTATSGSTTNMTVTTGAASGFSAGDQVVFSLVGSPVGLYGNIARLFGRQFTIQSITDSTDFVVVDALTGTFDATRVTLGSNNILVSRIVTFATPYTAGDLAALNIVQTDTAVYILSVNHPPQLLTQVLSPSQSPTGFATFTFGAATFSDGPYHDPPTDGSYLTPGGTTSPVTLTGTNGTLGNFINFQATDVGRLIRLFSEPQQWASGTTYAAGSTVKFANAYWSSLVSSNVGHQPDLDATHWAVDTSAAAWTWGTIASVLSSTVCTVNLAAADPLGVMAGGSLLQTGKIYTFQVGVYSPTSGYPSTGTFHEGRIWLGTSAQGNRFDASMSNEPNNFAPTAIDGTVADNNGISEVLEAADVSTVFWMEPDHTGIVMGTQSGEWLVQASTLSDPLTPTSIQAHRVSRYGSENIRPVHPPFSVIFVRRFSTKLTELIADTFSSRYVGRNLSETAAHFCAPGIKKIAYQQETTPVVWVLMNDGTLCGMTYRRDSPWGTQPPTFSGWHKHSLGTGRTILDIQVGPSVDGSKDTLTLLTKDPVTGYCYVELLTDIFLETTPIQDAWFLDGAVNPGGADIINGNTLRFYGLDYFIGKTLTVWGAGLDLGDYLVPSTGQIDVPFSANSLMTSAYLAGLQGQSFSYSTTLVPAGGGGIGWTVAAEDNYDPATEAIIKSIYGPGGTGGSIAASWNDQNPIGMTYDRVRRQFVYELGFSRTSPVTNTTGYTLSDGNQIFTPGASITATQFGNHSVLTKAVDAPYTVIAYPNYTSTSIVPSGKGNYQNILTATIAGGSSYTNGTYKFVPLTGGSGIYAFADIVVSGNAVTSVTMIWAYNYKVSDVLTTAAANIGGTGSGFTYTVNTIGTVSDGTWRRITNMTTNTFNLPRVINPRNGDVWTHAQGDGTGGFGCMIYLFRNADNYAQVISPLFPAEGADWSSHMQPQCITANYFYHVEYPTVGSATYFVGSPAGIDANETNADYLLPYFWFTTPQSFNTWYYQTATDTSGNTYFFTVNPASRNYKVYWFAEPSAATPYNQGTVGGGFTDITPWSSSTGPNTHASAYTGQTYPGWDPAPVTVCEALQIYYIPVSDTLVTIAKFFPVDKTSGNQSDLFFDCTYVTHPSGSPSFTYEHAFVSGFMSSAWAPVASSGNTIPAGAAWAVIDCQELDSYINQSSYKYVDGNMNYNQRWFLFTVQAVTSGTFTADSTQYQIIHVLYDFTALGVPVVAKMYTEAGWDAALTANADYPGRTSISGTYLIAKLISSRLVTNSNVYDVGVFDPVTDSFWWSGGAVSTTMWDVSNTFWTNYGNNSNLINPLAPILRLGFTNTGFEVAPFSLGSTYETDCQIVRALDPREAGAANGPALGKTRRTHMASVLFNGAQGVSIGTDFTHMRAISFKLSQESVTTAPLNQLYSDVYWETLDDDNGYDSEFAWKITRPYPCTVVAVQQFLHTQDR